MLGFQNSDFCDHSRTSMANWGWMPSLSSSRRAWFRQRSVMASLLAPRHPRAAIISTRRLHRASTSARGSAAGFFAILLLGLVAGVASGGGVAVTDEEGF